MENYTVEDTVWHIDTQIEWHINSRASAFEDEPPVRWKCERWNEGKLVSDIFPEEKLTKLKPPMPDPKKQPGRAIFGSFTEPPKNSNRF